MPDEPQNPISTENPSPVSPQEPTKPAPENTAHSEPSTMPPEPLESPTNSESAVPVNNDNSPLNEPEPIRPESVEAPEMPENQSSNEPKQETAQTPVNEPLENKSKPSIARQLLISARNAIQFRKRKKLEKVMSLFLKQSKITNDEVEKFLHVSDATATRYLSILEKEGKIKQNGKTGHMVSYSRI